MTNEWLIWQLIDSAFPTGGFAHSGGIEAAWQQGCINDTSLIDVFHEGLTQACHGALPISYVVHDDPHQFSDVDRFCNAFLANHVANRASREQGQALLASTERIFCKPALRQLKAQCKAEHLYCHLAPVFGFVTACLGVSRAESARLFLFQTLRGMVSSTVRLGIVGPMEGQKIQSQLAHKAEAMAISSMHFSLEDIYQTWPIMEISQSGHDRLYSRLFHS